MLELVVVDHDVVEAGFPTGGGADVETDAHAALVVDGNGAEKLAVLAAEKDGAADLDVGGGEIGAEQLSGGLEDDGGNHVAVEHEDERQAAQAQAHFGLDVVDADGGIAGKGAERPDGGAEAGNLADAAVERDFAQLGRERGDGVLIRHGGGGEDDGVGALDDVGEGIVERGVVGVAVVEAHLEDDALRGVIDEAAQDERVIEARPGPGAVGRNGVDGDERELVAGRGADRKGGPDAS